MSHALATQTCVRIMARTYRLQNDASRAEFERASNQSGGEDARTQSEVSDLRRAKAARRPDRCLAPSPHASKTWANIGVSLDSEPDSTQSETLAFGLESSLKTLLVVEFVDAGSPVCLEARRHCFWASHSAI